MEAGDGEADSEIGVGAVAEQEDGAGEGSDVDAGRAIPLSSLPSLQQGNPLPGDPLEEALSLMERLLERCPDERDSLLATQRLLSSLSPRSGSEASLPTATATAASLHLSTRSGTGLKGVYPSGRHRYAAIAFASGKRIRLGSYSTAEEAARRYARHASGEARQEDEGGGNLSACGSGGGEGEDPFRRNAPLLASLGPLVRDGLLLHPDESILEIAFQVNRRLDLLREGQAYRQGWANLTHSSLPAVHSLLSPARSLLIVGSGECSEAIVHCLASLTPLDVTCIEVDGWSVACARRLLGSVGGRETGNGVYSLRASTLRLLHRDATLRLTARGMDLVYSTAVDGGRELARAVWEAAWSAGARLCMLSSMWRSLDNPERTSPCSPGIRKLDVTLAGSGKKVTLLCGWVSEEEARRGCIESASS